MKLSQLLTIIDKTEELFITDRDAPISEMPVYEGRAGDIANDNPLNEMNVVNISPHLCSLFILVERAQI